MSFRSFRTPRLRPVRFRDLPYARAAVVYAITGLSQQAVDGLHDALVAYVSLPSALEFRARLTATDPESVSALAATAIVHVDAGLSQQDLMTKAAALGFDRLPTRIVVSGDSVAIAVSHGFMDGGPILEYVVWLLSASVGGTARKDTREPVGRPFWIGLRKAGRAGLRSFAAARKEPRAPMVVAPLPLDADGELIRRSIALHLDPDLVDRITSAPTAGPATAAAHIASTGVAALARVYHGQGDPPVTVPVDLRRFVGNQRVLGNFMGVGAYSSLRGSSWTADALTARLQSATSDGSAMVTGYIAVLRWLFWSVRSRIDPRRRRMQARTEGLVTVFVPLLGVRKGPPSEVWATDRPHSVAIGSLGHDGSGAALNVLTLGKEVHISIGDESGTFDLDRFEEAFNAEIDSRTSMLSPGR